MDLLLRRWLVRTVLLGALLSLAALVGDPGAVPSGAPASRSDGLSASGATAAVDAVPAVVQDGATIDVERSLVAERAFDADAVLDLVDYEWEELLPGWTVTFSAGRDDLLGGTWSGERRVEIYVRDAHEPADLAMTLAHEVAHALDAVYFDDADRARWSVARGIDESEWWVDGGGNDFAAGSGDLAESFAVWTVGGPSYAALGPPDDGELALLEDLFTLPTADG
ncbi:MAG: hypothetical protein S0880_09630 [Actinomycetota bacterium]|nr:hypothetical protein [Actinomycetota bacterium]